MDREKDHKLIESVRAVSELNEKIWDQATVYITVVMGLGYGALFAVWGFTRSQMNQGADAVVGFLLALSVGSFVAYEVYKVWHVSNGLKRAMEIFEEHGHTVKFVEKLAEHQKNRIQDKLHAARFWPMSFLVSAASGFGAALLLLAHFLFLIFA